MGLPLKHTGKDMPPPHLRILNSWTGIIWIKQDNPSHQQQNKYIIKYTAKFLPTGTGTEKRGKRPHTKFPRRCVNKEEYKQHTVKCPSEKKNWNELKRILF